MDNLRDDSWNEIGQVAKAKAATKGMTEMLNALEIPLEGRHHSGIDDSRNLSKVILALLNKNFEFKQAMVHNSKRMK